MKVAHQGEFPRRSQREPRGVRGLARRYPELSCRIFLEHKRCDDWAADTGPKAWPSVVWERCS